MNSRTITPEFKNTKWTSTEIQRLCGLLIDGKSGTQIALILKRTIASVQSKVCNLKMSIRRNRPPLSDREFNKRYEIHIAKGGV